jgi:hypothetical protein
MVPKWRTFIELSGGSAEIFTYHRIGHFLQILQMLLGSFSQFELESGALVMWP